MGRKKGACSLFSLEERVSSAFRELARYLELQGASSFKVKAYLKAAKIVESMEPDLATRTEEGTLESLPGIGKATAEKIAQLHENGFIRQLSKLQNELGPGLLEVMSLTGLGAKKTLLLHTQLGITGLASLLEQLEAGTVATLKGFTAKSQEKLLREVETRLNRASSYLKSDLEKWGQELVSKLQTWPELCDAIVTGSVRRLCPSGERLEIRLRTESVEATLSRLSALGGRMVEGGEFPEVEFRHPSGCPVLLYLCPEGDDGMTLLRLTGPAQFRAHLDTLLQKTPVQPDLGELEILSSLGLATLPPELRHRNKLWISGWNRDFEMSDLGGSFHNHTTASDGANTISEMAAAALELKHSFLGISDHSRSLTIAGGLTERELVSQIEEISDLKDKTGSLQLFSSNECDILADGSLDYPEEILSQLDYVVIAVHSHFQQTRAAMTERLLKALDSPSARILAHPTGRIITKRDGYEADWESVFKKCQERKVAIEINASPWRLDVSEELLDLAVELDCLLAISPDAHSVQELGLVSHGFDMILRSKARREQIVNLWSLTDLRNWFEKGSNS